MNDMSAKFAPLPAVQDEEAFDTPGKEFRVGGIIAGIFFVGLLGFAALTPLDAGAFAEGVVTVSGNRQAVQHQDGGTVTSIAVREGAMVDEGDVLLTISAPEVVASERGLTAEAIALQAQMARLVAERDRLGSVPTPEEFANLAEGDRQLAEDALRGQRLLFEARRASLGNERSLLAQRTRQQQEQINGYEEQIYYNREQSRLIDEELVGLRTLGERGFVSKSQIRSTERAAADLDGNHGALRSQVASTSESIGETSLRMVSLDRDMMEQVADELRSAQVRLSEIIPRLTAAREQLARSQVRAPAGGRVVGLKVFTVGGVVAPGETLMEIVPQDRRLLIEAKASPTDADDLVVGMDTQIRFPALQERNMPILEGEIANVSADSFEDERTGERFFRIQVEVPPHELAVIREFREDGGLRPGLPAEVMVPLRKRSALSYLTEPLTQTLWRAGREH
ncbi:HlyD family type I secretion periplasmic adaptor subunit [Altererythrobacter sp. SALINAS58]|uniref:HlyD family type I secretion periplasmic adaptor subunit n=1 Tax=Alteripontixanthobacter muriae TaxID=2705546 RepID=UPI0015776971|nr:HlyD family type I secretion periplasmic adaptor subunit [Alteripontixanthobacter muriae]NTZ43381.1 HlyD family type I secretion periplasmic adaptor subunit [Alteripontixanthobacter muriae]